MVPSTRPRFAANAVGRILVLWSLLPGGAFSRAVSQAFCQDVPPIPAATVPAAKITVPAAASGHSASTGDVTPIAWEADRVAAPGELPWGEGMTLRPYGVLWGNAVYASSRTNPGAFTLWVPSRADQGEPAVEIDARRTRAGLILAGPLQMEGESYQFEGRLEFDFLGQFLTENRAGARLRHAYLALAGTEGRLLIGQTWDVISPLNPDTLNFSVGWAGGNIGFRRAQVRFERTIPLAGESQLLLQSSLNQDIVEDFPTDPGVRRETASWPVLQGRAAFSVPISTDRAPIQGGVSGHYGETGFDFLATGPPPLNLPPANDVRIETWSLNVDLLWPLTERLTLSGEFFHGANLSPFLGGIGQGVCPCLRQPIRSTGGWAQLARRWSETWSSHLGGGIDDPLDRDSLLGRVQNQFVFINLVWTPAPRFSTGWELTWWRTDYQEQRAGRVPDALLAPDAPGESLTAEWMVRYDF